MQTLIKRNWSDYINAKSCRFQSKGHYQGLRRTLHNEKGIDESRGHSNQREPQKYFKQKTTEMQVEIGIFTARIGGCNTHLSASGEIRT